MVLKKTLIIMTLLMTFSSLYSEDVVLQLKWFHQFQFAGYYMALEKGFYEANDLQVEIRKGGPSLNVADEVTSGNAEFGVLGSELLLHRAEGDEVVVIAPIMQHSIRTIIADREKGIYSLHDLAGKRIMLNTNELPEFQAMFENEGIPFESLLVEPKNPDSNTMFIDGQIAALNGSIANQPFLFDREEKDIILFRPITYGIDFYGDTLFCTESYANGNPQTVIRFKEASLKGWKYAFDNPEETVELIREKYRSSKSIEHLYFEYEKLKSLIEPELVQIGHNNPERWKHIENTYRELGLLNQSINYNRFIFNPERKRERLIRIGLTVSILTTVLFLFFYLLGLYSNSKLNKVVAIRTAQLTSLIESMPVILIGINLEGAIITWNKRAEEISDLTEKDVLGRNIFEIFPYLSDIEEEMREHIRGRKIYRNDKYKTEEKGAISYREISLYPVQNHKIHCSALRIEEVTQKILQNESMAHNEKLLSLGTMAAGLAHEINNPLAGIIQSSEVLKSRLYNSVMSGRNAEYAREAGLPVKALLEYLEMREVPRLLSTIDECSRRVSTIVDSFLSYAKKEDETVVSFSLPDLVDESLNLINFESINNEDNDSGEIAIRREFDSDLPFIVTHRDKLRQVLLNILRNGIRVSPLLIISIRYEENSGFSISIEDKGPGMTEKVRKKIFDPFFTTNEPGQGMGLGLSTSYQIVTEFLKGSLSVESAPEKGARFVVQLPSNLSDTF